MTDEQWSSSDNPFPMLKHLEGKASDRKLRLFICACARRIWPLMGKKPRQAIELAERYADEDGVTAAGLAACLAFRKGERNSVATARRACAPPGQLHDAAFFAALSAGLAAAKAVQPRRDLPVAKEAEAEQRLQAPLLRDIFGDPFRPATLAPACRKPTVVSIARAVYNERQLPSGELDPRRLAVLADALEETGAPDKPVAHLRGPGPHIRGCHVVDLCLGLS